MIRRPAVAGTFYEDTEGELKESIDACFLGPYGPGKLADPAPFITRNITGLVAPHAGYRFSGYAAASAYYALAEDGAPDTVVILGPNHRGLGAQAAIMTEGSWETPLGNAEVDSEVAESILKASELLRDDPRAHIPEHSIEVQIPFLQTISRKIKIVPIIISVLAWEDGMLFAENIGRGIAKALVGRNAVVIASTDFTHYESKSAAEKKDKDAIGAILALDSGQLLDTVVQKGITMCGAVPTAAAIIAAKALGATSGELLSYYTSGDILGDTSQVVGYGAIAMVKELTTRDS